MSTSVVSHRPSIDGIVAGWLAEKEGRTQSQNTRKIYREAVTRFRHFLWEHGLDMDSEPGLIAPAAQAWVSEAWNKEKEVGNATYNQRLAVLSSFYRYVQQQRPGQDVPNPIARLKRRPTQDYASAQPLSKKQTEQGIASINRSTFQGARDYALLVVALTTGRRVAELAALAKETIKGQPVITDDGEAITLFFKRCKGGKTMIDRLSPKASEAVRQWLLRNYGGLEAMPEGAPLWPALAYHGRGHPLTPRSISIICQRYLGSSKVHATRHTFAHQMEEAGAKISTIAAKLGHSNPNITGRYLAALRSEVNPFAEKLDDLLGL